MKSLKILVFDISGEYGHFRKFNTTSSPLTYSIPPRSALAGMLGAILGIEREIAPNVYPDDVIPVNEVFAPENAQFAIQVLAPINKVNIGFNLLDTGKSPSSFFNIQNRTQIEFELLKQLKFRIFLHHSDEEIFNELAQRIRDTRHHFTPYLGLSQFTANVRWIEQTEAIPDEQTQGYTEIITAVNLSKLTNKAPIQFRQDFYSVDTLPMAMRRDRVITQYAEILIEKKGNPILVNTDHYWKTKFGNILFL